MKAPKKKKNVRSDEIEGKVGRIYIPSQDIDNLALAKPKGVRRQRREAAAAAKDAQQDAPEARIGGGSGSRGTPGERWVAWALCSHSLKFG